MNNLMTKSFLSYADLKKQALKDLEEGTGGGDGFAGDESEEMDAEAAAELEAALRSSADKNLFKFFEEAGAAKDDMSSIRDVLLRIKQSNEEGRSVHKAEALRSLRSRINADIAEVLKTARRIRDRLEDMDRSNAANRRLSGYRAGSPIDRARTSVAAGLRKKLRELMMEFQDLRQGMAAEHREAVERRYFTVTGEVATEEAIERIVAEDQDLLRKAIAERGAGTAGMVAVVEEIQGRQCAAKEIERSLLELHQVFMDMAVMVEKQGETLDDIETHVTAAAHYVSRGAKELQAAKEHQRGSRKWICVAVIVFLLLILVVVVPVATSLRKA